MRAVALTTEDNPYDPFDEFYEWLAFDHLKGYNTCEYLARIAVTSDELTDEQNSKEIEWAIDEIISINNPESLKNDPDLYVKYKKVIKELPENSEKPPISKILK